MDEKVIEMLGKLLEGQTKLSSDIARVESNMARMESNMARMESDLGSKIGALFDAQKVQHEVSERILGRLDQLEAKVDKLELQTAHVRLVK